jgi:hypothetical protein
MRKVILAMLAVPVSVVAAAPAAQAQSHSDAVTEVVSKVRSLGGSAAVVKCQAGKRDGVRRCAVTFIARDGKQCKDNVVNVRRGGRVRGWNPVCTASAPSEPSPTIPAGAPRPQGGTEQPSSSEPPSKPQYAVTINSGVFPDGILSRTGLGCTTPAQRQWSNGQWYYFVDCGYETYTTDNQVFSDSELCYHNGTKWIFLGLTRKNPTTAYEWTQLGRSYLDPNRIDIGADCI